VSLPDPFLYFWILIGVRNDQHTKSLLISLFQKGEFLTPLFGKERLGEIFISLVVKERYIGFVF